VPEASPGPAAPIEPEDSYFERLAAPLPAILVPKEEVPEGHEREAETAAQRAARRLRSRLPPGYEPKSGADLTFDPRIAYEIALGIATPSEVFTKYGVPLDSARAMIGNEVFLTTLRKYKEEVTASGISFRLKAKIQAEDLLTHSYLMATDPEVPDSVRADLIKWTAKMAGLEPDAKDKSGAHAGGFQLNIMFAGAAPAAGRVIEAEVVRVEEDKS
jgi:hypothetical protein